MAVITSMRRLTLFLILIVLTATSIAGIMIHYDVEIMHFQKGSYIKDAGTFTEPNTHTYVFSDADICSEDACSDDGITVIVQHRNASVS